MVAIDGEIFISIENETVEYLQCESAPVFRICLGSHMFTVPCQRVRPSEKRWKYPSRSPKGHSRPTSR